MRRVVVVATGGTIASRAGADGALRPVDPAETLLRRATLPPGVSVTGVDVETVGSFAMSPAAMASVVARARAETAAPDVVGVVVTHGTDTMEATAFMADLLHDGPAPVVFTGAMRPADAVDTDGPRNLGDAVAVAASPAAAGLGALVVLDGAVHLAAGVRKIDTCATAAFGSPTSGPVGRVVDAGVEIARSPSPGEVERVRSTGLRGTSPDLAGVRVDVVPSYPGADATLVDAAVGAGARGIVLEGTGAGNATPALCGAVASVVESGVVVALTTRVHGGPVSPVYGGGGGADLVAAGAVPVRWLRAPQVLVLTACLLANSPDPSPTRRVLALW